MKILNLVLVLIFSALPWAHAGEFSDLGTLVVEASRSNDTVGNMNKDVTIITSDDIAASPAKSLPDLLDQVPAVDVRVFSNIKNEQINMGQFPDTSISNVLVLVDGRRLNTPDGAGPDLSTIDLNSIDRIEIIQGAGTVLYGDNADAGVINIITKKGEANTKPSVTLSSEIDSYKGNKDGISVSGGFPKLTYALNDDWQQNNNYRSNSNYWANDYDSHLEFNPTDIFGIDFSQGYHLDRYRLPGGIKSTDISTAGETGVNPNITSYDTTSDSYFTVTPHMKFDEGSSNVDLSLLTSARKDITNSVYPGLTPPGSSYAQNYEEEIYELQPKLILSTPLTDRLDNKLTAGYDYIYSMEKRRYNSGGYPEDIVFASENSYGTYLLDEITLDQHWLLNAGARGAWTDYVFDQTQQEEMKLVRASTTEAYDGGLGYKYNPNSRVFVDYTRSYRLPNLDEFFQTPYPGSPIGVTSNLTYQVGNQYQLGIKDNSIKNVHLGFTATEVQYKNEIFFDPIADVYGSNANYNGKTRHISQEFDAAVDMFNKKIQPFANLTFQQAHFVSGEYSGRQIPLVPDHLANAGLTWRPLEDLSTSLSAHFVDKQYLINDEANTEPQIKRSVTFDWSAKYDFKNVELWVNLNNIFNKKYYVYGAHSVSGGPGDEVYYPAPGTNVAAGIKVKF